MTVAFFVFATGLKEKPIVIWKSENPRCLRRFDKSILPVDYYSQGKAWMTGDYGVYSEPAKSTPITHKLIHSADDRQCRLLSRLFKLKILQHKGLLSPCKYNSAFGSRYNPELQSSLSYPLLN